MSGPKQNEGMADAVALPIAQSAYATFEEWVAAIRKVADETFLDYGWQESIDSMLDARPVLYDDE